MNLKVIIPKFRIKKFWLLACFILLIAAVFLCVDDSAAYNHPAINPQENQVTPSQLIEAVNNLRINNGLHPLSVHSILMQTAQQQADALVASEGAVGHTRPGGISYTDQLILLGYPLGGDLTQGGYRAENFTYTRLGMTAEDAIEMWLGDGPHTNTMLSPYYEDIGAGVAYASDGSGFLVIDTAMPTASGQPQDYTPSAPLPPGSADLSEYMQPIILATARADGDVIHKVQYGQALWSIAIAYGTKIEAIRLLNNLADNTIYTGQKLLIIKEATQAAPLATESAETTRTSRPTRTLSPKATSTIAPTSPPDQHSPATTPEASAGFSKTGMIVGLLILSVIIVGGIIWSAVKVEK